MNAELALTVEEAAQRAKVGRTLIFHELKAGRLDSMKIGRRRLISPEQLKRWLNRHVVGAPAS